MAKTMPSKPFNVVKVKLSFRANRATVTLIVSASDIKEGDRFDSNEESQGRVIAMEGFGECRYDARPDSIFVRCIANSDRGVIGNQWFNAYGEGEMVEVQRTVLTEWVELLLEGQSGEVLAAT